MILIRSNLREHIETSFSGLKNQAAAKAFPSPKALSTKLDSLLPTTQKGAHVITVPPAVAALFATAAVDMWLRAIHSFLMSASLQRASPVWASASGYYSSHYSIRAFAHLLGFFQLHHRKRKVHLVLNSGHLVCSFDPKTGSDREHQFYWRSVKADAQFHNDPLFRTNDATSNVAGVPCDSEISLRDYANYADHLGELLPFQPLDVVFLRDRVQFISQIQFTTPPAPQLARFPDIDNVQVLAYHRIVRFRRLLDEILGGGNRFWSLHRAPSWCMGIVNFQLTEQPGLQMLNTG
jgi:hypothetical protein